MAGRKIPIHNVTPGEALENNAFCMLPWIHMHITPDGKALPCCIGNMKYADSIGRKDKTFEQMVNSDFMKDLRLKMIKGERHEICNGCHRVEDSGSGSWSFRKTVNKKYGKYVGNILRRTEADGHIIEFKMRYFDIRLSHVCNMKCRTCNSGYSSLWEAEDKKQGINYTGDMMHDRNPTKFEEILEHVPHMEECYFAGGEPMVDDYHYYLLEALIEQGRTDVRLSYNTNLSRLKFKNYNVLELWEQFDGPVNIYSSIDHCDERAEYIRHGTKWPDIEKNIKTLLLEPNVNLQISSTVSMLNYTTLEPFYKKMMKAGLMPGGDWQLNPVYNPSWISVFNLPQHLKDKGREGVENIIDWINSDDKIIRMYRKRNYDFENQISNIKAFPELVDRDGIGFDPVRSHFVEETTRLDRLRKENFVDVFPELRELYE